MRGPSPPPGLVGDWGLPGGLAFSRICVARVPARGPQSGGCGGRSVTWPPWGGSRRGPRGAVPLNPRAAAFVSPRGCADHEALAPVWGAGSGASGSRWTDRRGDLFFKVAQNGTEASCCVFSFSFLTSDWKEGAFPRRDQVGIT